MGAVTLVAGTVTGCRQAAPTTRPVTSTTSPVVWPAPPTSAAGNGPGTTTPAPATPADPSAPTITLTGSPSAPVRVQGPAPLDDVLQDQGIPVTLPDGRTMWIFADTADLFSGPFMFQTSSAAFSEQATPNTLKYYVDDSGRPAEFLPRSAAELAKGTDTSYTGLWPMGATTVPDGRIIISYSKYHITLSPVTYTFEGSGLFEYRYPGIMDLQAPVVATRLADDIWTADDGPINSPVYHDGYVYFLTCPEWICYSVRTTPAELADRASYRWWTGSGWSASRDDRQALRIAGNEAPGRNPSIQWVPSLGAFAMTDTSVGSPDTKGLVWLAARPEGPWSEPAEYPLANCGNKGCYLPNVHPQSSTATTLRIAYSSGGTWGPTMWATDLPVKVNAPQRKTTYPQPVTVADTAEGLGVLAVGPVEQQGARQVSVVLPDQPSNLTTVTVAVEVSAAAGAGRLRVGPSGSPAPGQAVDYTPGTTVRRTLVMPVGPNGRIAVANEGPAAAQVKVSVLAWSAGAG